VGNAGLYAALPPGAYTFKGKISATTDNGLAISSAATSTSPKGTTLAGLQRLEARDFRGMITETVLAAKARSEELSRDN